MTDDAASAARVAAGAEVDGATRYALSVATGHGAFAGLQAAALSHVFVHAAAVPLLAFAYLFGMSRLRGWRELAALLSMLGVVVVYFTGYDVVVAAHLRGWGIAGVVAGGTALSFGMSYVLAEGVARVRARALAFPPRGPFGRPRAEPLPAEDVDRWEAGYFARLRASRDDGRRLLLLLRPFGWIMGMLLLSLMTESKAVGAVAASVAFFQVLVGVRMAAYSRRLDKPDAAEALRWDTRPPVLLLRSFRLEDQPADVLDRWSVRGFLNFSSWTDKRTYEEYIAEQFERIGPVVAIGRPDETVTPLGAARVHVGADWRESVLTMAATAQCVLMLVDDSPGVVWELEQVPALVGLQRVVLVMPIRSHGFHYEINDHARQPAWHGWEKRWAVLRERFAFLPEVTGTTVAVLFDDDGRPVLVDAGERVQDRVRMTRTAWERHRGTVEQKGQPRPTHQVREAAERALEAAALATVSGLGGVAPRRRGLRRRHSVAVGDVPAAVAEVEQQLDEINAALGPRHAVAGALHLMLGRLHQAGGDLPRARDDLAAATAILEDELGPFRPIVVFTRSLLGRTRAALQEFDAARGDYETVLAAIGHGVDPDGGTSSLEQMLALPLIDFSPGGPAEAGVRGGLASIQFQLGDLAAARAGFEAALPMFEAARRTLAPAPEADLPLGLMHAEFGRLLAALHAPAEALAQQERALALLVPLLGEDHPLVKQCRTYADRAQLSLVRAARTSRRGWSGRKPGRP